MYRPSFTITNAISQMLAEIERARGFLEAVNLSEEWLTRMQKRAFLLEAHHTTHIEGAQLSLDKSDKILEGKNVPEVNPDDKRELLNYRSAFEFVSSYLSEKKPITESLIRQIHTLLVQGVRRNSAIPGEYRTVQNFVVNSQTQEVIYTPPPAYLMPEMMSELIQWIREEREIHAILVAAIAQFQFVHIHPFLDGNGRTARLLSTLYLYKSGYDLKRLFTLSEFYDRERTAYYTAIQTVRDNRLDLTTWLEYFCTGLVTQLRELQEKSKKSLDAEHPSVEKTLSETQKKALQLATAGPFTLQDFVNACPTVSKRTLQRDLSHLQKCGLIASEGSTSARTYRLCRLR